MGARWVTGRFDSLGQNLLSRGGLSEKWQRRAQFYGTELVNTRKTWTDYNLGLTEFKNQWKEGLYGRDLGGLFIVTLAILGGISVGRVIGRGQFEPFHLPHTKYPGVQVSDK